MDSSYELLNEYQNKLKNINLYSNAILLCEDYISRTVDITECNLMKSMLNQNNFIQKMDFNEFKYFLNEMHKIKFRDDGYNIIDNILKYTNCPAQINTVKRLIATKPLRPGVISLHSIRCNDCIPELVTKICPHCGLDKKDFSNIDYVICGHNNKGFDWRGCGFDWCFKCEKKLCKCWNVNHLYNIKNRYHNSKCCKGHAIKTGALYPEEYCQCRNKYVKR